MSTGGMLFSTEVVEGVGVASTAFATTFFLAALYFLARVCRCDVWRGVVGGTAAVGGGDGEIVVVPVGGDGAGHPPGDGEDGAGHPPGDGDVDPLCSLPQ